MRGTESGAAVAQMVLVTLVALAAIVPVHAQDTGRGGEAAPTARTAAPIDLTGQWVALITEDWRWRMVTPPRGDYASIPLTPEGKRVADTWDPARDQASGESCRAYGAPGLMRGPTRLRLSWQNDSTLRLESDYGMQTRLFHFGSVPPGSTTGARTWQGVSTAEWVMAAGRRGGAHRGSMKSVTTRLRAGYLRKNGVPYSAAAVFTEYWDVHVERNGDQYLVVTNTVDDPAYLQTPWVTSVHFRKEVDGSRWNPVPCSARF